VIGVPLQDVRTGAGFDHEQRRVGFNGEGLDVLAVATQMPFDLAGRTVADRQPDDLRRRTVEGGRTERPLKSPSFDTMVKPC